MLLSFYQMHTLYGNTQHVTKKISSDVEVVFKAQNLRCIKENKKWYWKGKQ